MGLSDYIFNKFFKDRVVCTNDEYNKKTRRYLLHQIGRQRNIIARLIKMMAEEKDLNVPGEIYADKLTLLYESIVSEHMSEIYLCDDIVNESESLSEFHASVANTSCRTIMPKKIFVKER